MEGYGTRKRVDGCGEWLNNGGGGDERRREREKEGEVDTAPERYCTYMPQPSIGHSTKENKKYFYDQLGAALQSEQMAGCQPGRHARRGGHLREVGDGALHRLTGYLSISLYLSIPPLG